MIKTVNARRWFQGGIIGLALVMGEALSAAPMQDAPPGWFHVFPLDRNTFAISEPKYWQQNVSYLIIGTNRALLFDSGPGLYSIKRIVDGLSHLPLIVIPSHLHFDHVGDLHEFRDVRLLDTPTLRGQVRDGMFTESSDQFMLRTTERFHVEGWVKNGEVIHLGDRSVTILSTPGHTPDSLSVVDDQKRHRIFTGDLVNRLVTLCNVPGSDIKALAASLHHIMHVAADGSLAYEAHSEVPLQHVEIEQLASGVDQIASGRSVPVASCLGGIPMRRFNIGAFAILLPQEGGSLMTPLENATQELDWLATPCTAGT